MCWLAVFQAGMVPDESVDVEAIMREDDVDILSYMGWQLVDVGKSCTSTDGDDIEVSQTSET